MRARVFECDWDGALARKGRLQTDGCLPAARPCCEAAHGWPQPLVEGSEAGRRAPMAMATQEMIRMKESTSFWN